MCSAPDLAVRPRFLPVPSTLFLRPCPLKPVPMNSQSPQLLVVGSVAIDWIITPRAERKESVGGSATFFAMAASYLAQVRLVGVVGGDFPPAAVADLRAA